MAAETNDPLRLVENAYRQHFETEPTRASVSFLGVEPIEILRFEGEADSGRPETHYLSLGMSRYPMADPSATVVDAAGAPRGELHLCVAGRQDDVWRKLAVLAAAPAVESTVYSPGDRIDLAEPWVPGSRCSGAVLAPGLLQQVAVPAIEPVSILRVLPAHPAELAWARVHGTDMLMQRWRDKGVETGNLFRPPTDLD